nr:double homeobox protein 4C-like [Meriones unguiculatus]
MDLKCTFGMLEKEARRRRIILNQNQKDTLHAWFEKNPNPDLATRGHLAKELGISESQIMTWFQKHRKMQKQVEYEYCFEESQGQGQDKPKGVSIWFQNRRARHPEPRQSPQANVKYPRIRQHLAQKTACQLVPSKAPATSSSVLSPLSPPPTPSGPLDLSRGRQKQLSRTTALQPPQLVQRRGDGQNSSVFAGHSPRVGTSGEEAFCAWAPLGLPTQERWQDSSENSGLAIPPLEHSTQAPAVNQHFQEPDPKDPAFLQHWDKWIQSMLAEWMPDKEYWSLEKAELHPWQEPLRQPADVPHQADQTPQQ